MKMTLTDSAPEQQSWISTFVGETVQAGVYNEGLVTICGTGNDISLPDAWRFLPIGPQPLIYAYNATGSFFVSSRDGQRAFYVTRQSVLAVHLATGISGNFGRWYEDDETLDALLSRDIFVPILSHLGPLKYGQCYTTEPFMFMGGADEPESHTIVDFATHLEVLSQSLLKCPWIEPEILT